MLFMLIQKDLTASLDLPFTSGVTHQIPGYPLLCPVDQVVNQCREIDDEYCAGKKQAAKEGDGIPEEFHITAFNRCLVGVLSARCPPAILASSSFRR